MSGLAQFVTVELTNLQCWCGMAFAVPDTLYRSVREERSGDIRAVHCPVGHSNVWKKSEVQILRDKLATKESELEFARAAKDAAERRERSAKGKVTRLTRRINNGVCPHCNRHFQNVERHMASKHPQEESATA